MSKKKLVIRLVTPEFRMSYANLVTPRAYKEGAAEKYSVQGIFKPDDLNHFHYLSEDPDEGFVETSLTKMLQKVFKDTWPGEVLKEKFKQGDNWPIHSGDKMIEERKAAGKKIIEDAYEGMKVLRFSSGTDIPPQLMYKEGGKRFSIDRSSKESLAKAEQLFASGNYCRAVVNLTGQTVNKNDFMIFYINECLFTRTGERLGAASTMDRFDDLTGGISTEDPTVGLEDDDEIPF